MGLRGDQLSRLAESTDVLLFATLGYQWLRFSVGGSYTSEVHDLAAVEEGDTTTDPNALLTERTRRKLRPAIALHMSF